MRFRQSFLVFALIFLPYIVAAQYYETGQDPASLKWMQIKTGRFTVIYPEKYGAEGLLYAKTLDKAYARLVLLFPDRKFNIPVVIHNYTVQSNGYVSWAPKRIELYPTPEQNTIPLAAETQLAVHELTHVFQLESLNQGFSKYMSYVLGEQFTGVVASLLPEWFLEGDAVFAESVLTPSGRGRTPAFQKPLKALIVDGKKPYKYDKILNGSYKDFVPDYYQTGYQMVTLALTKDQQVWNKVLNFTADQPFTINPVNISLSRNTGLRKKALWYQTYDSLKYIWTKDISENNPVSYPHLNPDKHGKFINYYSPVIVDDDNIIAIKTSLSDPASFVLINSRLKTEKRIHTPGNIYPWFLSYGNGKLVWVETVPDPRWENREYSIIKLMDTRNKKIKIISRRSRFLAASVSPDGKEIAGVENTIDNINNLVLIDAESGSMNESVHVPGNVSLQHPQWASGKKQLTFIFLSEDGEGIISYNPGNHEWKTLLPAGRNDLQSAFLRNDSLFFVGSSSGTDNIYIQTPDKKIVSLTHSKFGVTDAISSGDKICFGNYSLLGNEISSTTIRIEKTNDRISSSSFLINRFNIKKTDSSDSSNSKYVAEPYRKWQHLFRFHSWMPFYADITDVKVDPASVRPGVTLLTQNTLSTLISTIGYEYSTQKRNLLHTHIKWSGWYPVIESQLDYGAYPVVYKLAENVENPANIQPNISFQNTISLPLHFNTGNFSQFLQPSFTSDYVNQYIFDKEKGTYEYGQTIMTGRVYFTNYFASGLRDIYPRWAQVLDFNYCFAPFNKDIYGSEISLKTAFYFPGLFPNHGIKIRVETDKQESQKYLYGNFSSLPRGYSNIIAKGITFLSADYALPLAYPDFNVASLLYLKRIRASLFYDYAEGPGNSLYKITANGLVPFYNNPESESFKSFGFELVGDFHLFRIPYMISGGIQSAWKTIKGSPTIEFLFNIDLYGMTIGRRRI
jgi:hypothetical protein